MARRLQPRVVCTPLIVFGITLFLTISSLTLAPATAESIHVSPKRRVRRLLDLVSNPFYGSIPSLFRGATPASAAAQRVLLGPALGTELAASTQLSSVQSSVVLPTDQSLRQSPEESLRQSSKQSLGLTTKQWLEQSSGQSLKQSSGQSLEQSADQSLEQSSGQSSEDSSDESPVVLPAASATKTSVLKPHDATWTALHNKYSRTADLLPSADVIFYGDSLTEAFQGSTLNRAGISASPVFVVSTWTGLARHVQGSDDRSLRGCEVSSLVARSQSHSFRIFVAIVACRGSSRHGCRKDSLSSGVFESVKAAVGATVVQAFGIAGDTVDDVRERMESGEFPPSLQLRVAVVCAGINDVLQGRTSAATTANKVASLAVSVRKAHPSTSVLVLGLLPEAATSKNASLPDPVPAQVNAVLASALQSVDGVSFLDCSSAFTNPGGSINAAAYAPDSFRYLHLSAAGYKAWSGCFSPQIKTMLKEASASPAVPTPPVRTPSTPPISSTPSKPSPPPLKSPPTTSPLPSNSSPHKQPSQQPPKEKAPSANSTKTKSPPTKASPSKSPPSSPPPSTDPSAKAPPSKAPPSKPPPSKAPPSKAPPQQSPSPSKPSPLPAASTPNRTSDTPAKLPAKSSASSSRSPHKSHEKKQSPYKQSPYKQSPYKQSPYKQSPHKQSPYKQSPTKEPPAADLPPPPSESLPNTTGNSSRSPNTGDVTSGNVMDGNVTGGRRGPTAANPVEKQPASDTLPSDSANLPPASQPLKPKVTDNPLPSAMPSLPVSPPSLPPLSPAPLPKLLPPVATPSSPAPSALSFVVLPPNSSASHGASYGTSHAPRHGATTSAIRPSINAAISAPPSIPRPPVGNTSSAIPGAVPAASVAATAAASPAAGSTSASNSASIREEHQLQPQLQDQTQPHPQQGRSTAGIHSQGQSQSHVHPQQHQPPPIRAALPPTFGGHVAAGAGGLAGQIEAVDRVFDLVALRTKVEMPLCCHCAHHVCQEIDTQIEAVDRVFDLVALRTKVEMPLCCHCAHHVCQEIDAQRLLFLLPQKSPLASAAFATTATAGEPMGEDAFRQHMAEVEEEERRLQQEAEELEQQRAQLRAQLGEVEAEQAELDAAEERHRIIPMGSFPRISDGHNQFELFGPVNLFWSTRYDRAMLLFLQALTEFAAFANAHDRANHVPPEKSFQLPYKIEGDKIQGLTVKQSFNREERWTKALKSAPHAKVVLETGSSRGAHVPAVRPQVGARVDHDQLPPSSPYTTPCHTEPSRTP
ncbi:unnamed protein product [Closterium sp. Yama58-4]|nr:unnamed protein product [Closterium sp. Yama58-4]